MLNDRVNKAYEASSMLVNEFDAHYSESDDASNPGIRAFIERVEKWIRESVELGRYIPEGAGERRALQGQIDYVVSLLRRFRFHPRNSRLDKFDESASAPLEGECPYPGLRAYGSNVEQADRHELDLTYFLGRDVEIAQCLTLLKTCPILSIVAGSGTGKSSLVFAGVLPRINEALGPDWTVLPRITPGDDPMQSLASAFGSDSETESHDRLREMLERVASAADPKRAEVIAGLLNEGRVVIFIDQFEELFSLCRDVAARDLYSRVLLALAGSKEAPAASVRIVTTMRTDHLSYLERDEPELYSLMKHGEFRPGPLDFVRLKQVIEKPAKEIGLRFVPPSIVDELAGAAASLAAGLPLLQFALFRLWDGREKDTDGRRRDLITAKDVERLPSVQHALGKAADELYKSLPPEGQKICERLTLELAEVADNSIDPLRRRRDEMALRDIVAQQLKVPVSKVTDTLDRFVAAKLLMRSGFGSTQQIEVSHEALFTHWEVFRDDWLVAAKEKLVRIKTLERETAAWVEATQRLAPDAGDLLKQTGGPLAEAVKLKDGQWLSPDGSAYVDACMERERAEIAKEEAALAAARARDVAEQTLHTQRILFIAFALLLSFLAAGAFFIGQSRAAANVALVSLTSMLDRLPVTDAVSVASYLSSNHRDEVFTRALLRTRDRIADVHALNRYPGEAQFVNGGRGIIQTPTHDRTKPIVLRLLNEDGTPTNALNGEIPLTPPAGGFHDIAMTTGGPAVGVGRDIREKDDQAVQPVWVIWGKPPGASAKGGLALQLIDVKNGRRAILEERIMDGNETGSFWLSDDGSHALLVAIERSGPQKTITGSTMHNFVFNDRHLDESKLSSDCDRFENTLRLGSDLILSAAFLRSDVSADFPRSPSNTDAVPPHDTSCPVTTRADGSIVCPNGTAIDRNPDEIPTEIPAIYPSSSGATFATFGPEKKLRVRQCEKHPEDAKTNGEQSSPISDGFDVKNVSFGKNSIYALTDGRIGCWALNERGLPVGGYPCLTAVKADGVALEPKGGERMWYLQNTPVGKSEMNENVTLIRARRLPDIKGTTLGNDWAWAVSSGVSLVRYSIAGAIPGFIAPRVVYTRPNSIDGSEVTADQNVMTASQSADGKWLVYATPKGPSAEEQYAVVFLQRLKGGVPSGEPVALGTPNQINLVQTRVAVVSGAKGDPIVFVALANQLHSRTPETTWEPIPLKTGASANDSIECMSTSADGAWLVMGMQSGGVAQLNRSSKGWVSAAPPAALNSAVHACATANDGTAVIGDDQGRVYLLNRSHELDAAPTLEELTLRAASKLVTDVISVSIDANGKFASALGAHQEQECSELTDPGQSLRVWRAKDDTVDGHVPVASRCFVDADIQSISAVDANGNIMLYRSDGKYDHYTCALCGEASQEDTREHAMEQLNRTGMTPASAGEVENRFGLEPVSRVDETWHYLISLFKR